MLRQDKKSRVIGYKMEPVVLMAKIPSDPLVSSSVFQSCGGKTENGKPFALWCEGDIPKSITNFRQAPKVVMRLHKFLKQ